MRILATVVVASLALSLGACSDEDPRPADPTSSATTPANPDATLPPMPAVAKEFTPNGAADFVSYYVSVLDYASKTGDVDELANLSDPECEGCTRYVDLFRELYENGGHAEGRDWTGSAIDLRFQKASGYESFATTTLRISAGTVQDGAESRPTDYPEATDEVTFALVFDGSWRITQFVTGGAE